MATKYLTLVLCALLISCGSSPSSQPQAVSFQGPTSPTLPTTWVGGLVGVWEPIGTPHGVMILHQGHDSFTGERYGRGGLVPAAESFRNAGFIVYGFEMPVLDSDIHEHGPIERFYEPVIKLIDAIGTNLPIYMAGVSGGGWTTTVVTGIEPRITKGYSVEGDPWFYLGHNSGRTSDGREDWEQFNMPWTYEKLYESAGSRLAHIFIPGSYSSCQNWTFGECVNDYSTTYHEISPWAVEFIVSDIKLAAGQ